MIAKFTVEKFSRTREVQQPTIPPWIQSFNTQERKYFKFVLNLLLLPREPQDSQGAAAARSRKE